MLTDKQIQGLTARAKPYRVADAQSMVIEVSPSGARAFRLRYRIKVGDVVKARMLTLGNYPDMTIRQAREKAAEARKLIQQGKDPVQQQRVAAMRAAAATAATFGAVFELVASDKKAKRKDPDGRPQKTFERTAQTYLVKHLGGIPLADITSTQLHTLIAKVYNRIPGTGATLVAIVNDVYAMAHRRDIYRGNNPAQFLGKDFPRPASKSQPSARDCESIGSVMRRVADLGFFPRTFLRLIAFTCVRSIELRLASWREFDLDAALWVVPAERMKMRRGHIVPLSTQAVAILRELYDITGRTGVVFPALKRSKSPYMSDSTVRKALGGMLEYVGEHSTHGFRGTATTVLRQCRFDRDAVFLSIAHWSKAKGEEADATYDSADLLPYRRVMMQGYADYLDRVTAGDPDPLAGLKAVRVLLRDSLD